MNFARRTNGIKVARTIFKRAREDGRCGYQAYVAAALLEYYNTKVSELLWVWLKRLITKIFQKCYKFIHFAEIFML